VIAFNHLTASEDTVPDGFHGLDAQQVAAYLPQDMAVLSAYGLRLTDGAAPLDAWLHVTATALGLTPANRPA
jgi:hypothetical protein